MKNTRRDFIKKVALGTAGIAVGKMVMGMDAKSYNKILGSNDRVRVGIVGFSERGRDALFPAFIKIADEMNFEFAALSDIWSLRREEGLAFIKEKSGKDIKACRNNDELYSMKDIDAVIISTADFQHAYHCIEAVKAGRDVYTEKPLADTMEDAKAVLKAVQDTKKVVQVGTQRRSFAKYIAANEYLKTGKFGDIKFIEMSFNVNQPGRWRRPELVSKLRKEDTDWDRFLCSRPKEEWDPRKYLEYRLFWPYSSGIPGQWMVHQIDVVHWYTGLDHPRSVVANGGIYMWNDGRKNADTMTAVFDYGSGDDMAKAFQVVFSSRMYNSDGGVKEIYYSNGGKLDMDTGKVTPDGGLQEKAAAAMGMKANLVEELSLDDAAQKIITSAKTGADDITIAHMRNWMECIRSRQEPNAGIKAGYNHSIASIMTNAALHSGCKATFDEATQEVMAGDKPFRY